MDAFSQLGFPSRLFGLHSLRSGGATAAANAGVNDRLFKPHGQWRTDKAKHGYVADSLDALLSVSKSLELYFLVPLFLFLYFNICGDSLAIIKRDAFFLILVCVL